MLSWRSPFSLTRGLRLRVVDPDLVQVSEHVGLIYGRRREGPPRDRLDEWMDFRDGFGPRPENPGLPPLRSRRRVGPGRAERLASALSCAGGVLQGLMLTQQQSVRGCEPTVELVRCGCKWRKVQSGCMDRDCSECKAAVGRRRAARVGARLSEGCPKDARGRMYPLCYTVLTVPPELRERFANPKAWRGLGRRAWKVLKRQFGGVFGVEATHPVGDEKAPDHRAAGETEAGGFHPHLNFLWVRSTYHGEIDTDKLRAAWAEILGVELDRSNVWHEFRTGEVQRAHCVRYVTRSFPGWSFWLPSLRWYGKYPKKPKAKECRCDKCGERFRTVARGAVDVAAFAARFTLAGLPEGSRLARGQPPPWGDA